MRFLKIAPLALALAFGSYPALAGKGAAGHSHGDAFAYGEPGDPDTGSRVIRITMVEEDDGRMLFVPQRIRVREGEQIRFVFENHGALEHEFVLGTEAEIEEHAELMRRFPNMEHDDPNSERVVASAKGELVWRFTKAGSFEFACLIPGHMELGMIGTITVTH